MADDGYYERKEMNNLYDDIDMSDQYRHGFYWGAAAGALGMFFLCLLIGVFLV